MTIASAPVVLIHGMLTHSSNQLMELLSGESIYFSSYDDAPTISLIRCDEDKCGVNIIRRCPRCLAQLSLSISVIIGERRMSKLDTKRYIILQQWLTFSRCEFFSWSRAVYVRRLVSGGFLHQLKKKRSFFSVRATVDSHTHHTPSNSITLSTHSPTLWGFIDHTRVSSRFPREALLDRILLKIFGGTLVTNIPILLVNILCLYVTRSTRVETLSLSLCRLLLLLD